ncbi:MAG TPA: membrane dipeptidase [Streptosporangiaceae bacterium]|jgi:membrane dipeptidase
MDAYGGGFVADTHNDLLMAVAARPPERWGAFFAERWLPRLREGGVGVQVLPVFVDNREYQEAALRTTLRMIECAHRVAEACPESVALCRDGAEIDAALASGRIALVLALEAAPGVDRDVELLATLFRLGVRVASLVHYGRTALADGSGEDDTARGRLTRAGVAALSAMERLGMIFDVSHLGAAGVAHVLELATRPVMATHSSARALCDHHRNLTDDQLRGLAATGGVVCANFYPPFLAADPAAATLDTLADHIAHIAGVAGIDHVGLGPDFMADVMTDLLPHWCEAEETGSDWDIRAPLPGAAGPSDFPAVAERLAERGFDAEARTKILGGNVARLFRAELGRPGAV